MKKITELIAILGLLFVCSNSLVAEMVIESDSLGLDNGMMNDAYMINNDDSMMLDDGYMSDDVEYDTAPMAVSPVYGVQRMNDMKNVDDRMESNIEVREGMDRGMEDMNRGMNRGMEGGARGMGGHGGRR